MYELQGKVIFILGNVCLFTTGEGGTLARSQIGGRGTPILLIRGGTPIWQMWGTPIQLIGEEYPRSVLPCQDWMGVNPPPPPWDWMGVAPPLLGLDRGTLRHQDWMGIPPSCQETEQQSELLLCGRRYPLVFTQGDFLVKRVR